MASVPIVNVGYRSTNFWLIGGGQTRLLVDIGWPGMGTTLLAEIHRKGVKTEQVTHGLATHYHPDHAGAAEEMKQRGMKLLVVEEQRHAIDRLVKWTKPQDNYVAITTAGNITFPAAESRALLKRLGFDGEIVLTPGHSDDSVTLVLDDGSVFTGDLTAPGHATEEDAETVARSWQTLRDRGAKTIYPGHGPIRPMPALD